MHTPHASTFVGHELTAATTNDADGSGSGISDTNMPDASNATMRTWWWPGSVSGGNSNKQDVNEDRGTLPVTWQAYAHELAQQPQQPSPSSSSSTRTTSTVCSQALTTTAADTAAAAAYTPLYSGHMTTTTTATRTLPAPPPSPTLRCWRSRRGVPNGGGGGGGNALTTPTPASDSMTPRLTQSQCNGNNNNSSHSNNGSNGAVCVHAQGLHVRSSSSSMSVSYSSAEVSSLPTPLHATSPRTHEQRQTCATTAATAAVAALAVSKPPSCAAAASVAHAGHAAVPAATTMTPTTTWTAQQSALLSCACARHGCGSASSNSLQTLSVQGASFSVTSEDAATTMSGAGAEVCCVSGGGCGGGGGHAHATPRYAPRYTLCQTAFHKDDVVVQRMYDGDHVTTLTRTPAATASCGAYTSASSVPLLCSRQVQPQLPQQALQSQLTYYTLTNTRPVTAPQALCAATSPQSSSSLLSPAAGVQASLTTRPVSRQMIQQQQQQEQYWHADESGAHCMRDAPSLALATTAVATMTQQRDTPHACMCDGDDAGRRRDDAITTATTTATSPSRPAVPTPRALQLSQLQQQQQQPCTRGDVTSSTLSQSSQSPRAPLRLPLPTTTPAALTVRVGADALAVCAAQQRACMSRHGGAAAAAVAVSAAAASSSSSSRRQDNNYHGSSRGRQCVCSSEAAWHAVRSATESTLRQAQPVHAQAHAPRARDAATANSTEPQPPSSLPQEVVLRVGGVPLPAPPPRRALATPHTHTSSPAAASAATRGLSYVDGAATASANIVTADTDGRVGNDRLLLLRAGATTASQL